MFPLWIWASALIGLASSTLSVARDHLEEDIAHDQSVLDHDDEPHASMLDQNMSTDLAGKQGGYHAYNVCKSCFGETEYLTVPDKMEGGLRPVKFHKNEAKNDNVFCYNRFDFTCKDKGSKCSWAQSTI